MLVSGPGFGVLLQLLPRYVGRAVDFALLRFFGTYWWGGIILLAVSPVLKGRWWRCTCIICFQAATHAVRDKVDILHTLVTRC
jgi:hypothetical protein